MNGSMKELKALLGYLIAHNKDHAEEIMELAELALSLGKDDVHNKLTAGVDALLQSNSYLEAALQDLHPD